MSHEKEIIEKIKNDLKYSRILKEILIKYKKTGKFSGTIFLTDITEEEGLILAPLNYNLFLEKKGKISVNNFLNKILLVGNLSNVTAEDFFKQYYEKESLRTYKEIKNETFIKWETFINQIYESYINTKGGGWLKEAVKNKKFGYNIIKREYEKNENQIKVILHNVINGLNQLNFNKENLIPLTIFSTNISKDPHYFDLKNTATALLINGICFLLNKQYPYGVEETNNIFYESGIIRDTVSNSTVVFGINILKEELHKGVSGFNYHKEFVNLTLYNLINTKKVICDSKCAYIFENPVVFSEVFEKVKNINVCLICTSGQLNLSSIILLDKLVSENVTLYYSGDFDPEGLKIADKLKQRYKDRLILWRFTKEDYKKCISSVSIDNRLEKLKSLTQPQLIETAEELQKTNRAGYQEFLVEHYINDILTCFKTC